MQKHTDMHTFKHMGARCLHRAAGWASAQVSVYPPGPAKEASPSGFQTTRDWKEIWGLQGVKAEGGGMCVHSPPGGRTTPDGRPHAGRRRSRATAEGGPGAAPRSHDAPALGAASGEGEREGAGGGRGRQKGWVSGDRQGQNSWRAGSYLNNGRGQARGRGQREWRQEGPNACWAGP